MPKGKENMHSRILRFSAVACTLIFSACSSVETYKPATSLTTIRDAQRYQLLVRTGDSVLDKLVFEFAFAQFADVLPLREKEPYTGAMEVTFVSSGQNAFLGSSVTTGTAHGSGWYTGGGYVGGATVSATSGTVSSGTIFTWQNSSMIVVLKSADGTRLWSADYNYKGGWEMSGWSVNTPTEAARLVVKRLKERFKADFSIN